MSRSNRRLFAIIFSLILSITLLASSTYAWFTSNKLVTVDGVSVRISALNKLEVSADAKEFGSTVTLLDLQNASYEATVDRKNSLPTTFEPVSTIGTLVNGRLDMYHGIASLDIDDTSPNYGNTTLIAKSVTDVDGNHGKYMAFDMYFRSYNQKSIYLGNKSKVTYSGDLEGIENAIRVAFIYEGNVSNIDYDQVDSYIEDVQKLETSDPNNVIIWEPNSDAHTQNGISAAKNYYGLDIENPNATLPYKGIKAPIEVPVAINSTDETYFGDVNNLFSTSKNWKNTASENQHVFDLPVGISKVRIYAWVEGQDVDCENETSGSTFNFNIIFTTNPSASTK